MRSLFPIISLLCFFLLACGVSPHYSDSTPIQHDLWGSLVRKHVSPEGKVNYKGFKKDSYLLDQYLSLISQSHPNEKNWSETERLAYWINAYNAFTIKIMIDHYPVKSIKDIRKGIPFINSTWDVKFIEIEGQTYDLNNIEHGILRKQFSEPRIHFAIVCASASCPILRREAFTSEKLEKQLEEQSFDFINDTTKNLITSESKAQLSKIFSWFSGDFKIEGASVIDYVNRYSSTKLDPDAK
ncbi:MAG: DUF547 domain-containing protein, partial [Saprospiraceae bacterium]|nr:DUF547 domain-containing protein [Saprospiraceae bacterium]